MLIRICTYLRTCCCNFHLYYNLGIGIVTQTHGNVALERQVFKNKKERNAYALRMLHEWACGWLSAQSNVAWHLMLKYVSHSKTHYFQVMLFLVQFFCVIVSFCFWMLMRQWLIIHFFCTYVSMRQWKRILGSALYNPSDSRLIYNSFLLCIQHEGLLFASLCHFLSAWNFHARQVSSDQLIGSNYCNCE